MSITAGQYNKYLREVMPYGAQPMTAGALMSLIFHGLLVSVTIVGMPFVARDKLEVSTPISVEMVELDEISQTTRRAPPQKVEESEKSEAAPPPPKPAMPKMEQASAPDMTPEKAVKPKPVPPPPKPEPEKTEEKPEPKPEPEPKEESVSAKEPSKDFQSLLRNLTPDAQETRTEADNPDLNTDAPPQTSQIAPLGERITATEVDALRAQLSRCWNVMAGAKYAEDLVVEVRVQVNPDRTVRQAAVVNTGMYDRDPHFRAAADAALRALRNPACSPLALPPDKYEQWKTTVIRFDPREML